MASEDDEVERSIKEERREGVKKAFESPGPSAEPDPAQQQPAAGSKGVGESMTRRGEDVAKEEQEPGRYSTGTDGTPAERPTGESTRRDKGAFNPDE
jgi:hypothetical protein